MHTLNKIALSAALFASLTNPSFAFFDEMVKGLTSVTNNLIDSTENVTNNSVNTASTTMVSLSDNPGKMADRIGVMADRIGVMADRIGIMADRIVTTEAIMAGLAHKIIDRATEPRMIPQNASYPPAAHAPIPMYYPVNAPASAVNHAYGHNYLQPHQVQAQRVSSNPYSAYQAAAPASAIPHGSSIHHRQPYGHSYGFGASPAPTQTDNSRYSASYIIFGNTGSTYTAAQPRTAAPASRASHDARTVPAVVTNAGSSCGFSYGLPRRSC